ncbi:hypothetical protein HY570_02960 [Candidatus Micrarchaeota archaeon]|nr:hypothetical protein [Candidatus Micrarchaeota archaeon]
MRRGQAAFEFLSYFTFFLLIFIVIFTYMGSEQAREIRVREFEISKEITDNFASEVNLAVSVGDGYKRTFTFPTKILGKTNYSVFYRKGFVELTWSRGEDKFVYFSPLSTDNVTEFAVDVEKGYLRLNNTRGVIYIKQ